MTFDHKQASVIKIDSRKLKKVLNELIACVDKYEIKANHGGHLRGTGTFVGKVGNYYISLDVDQFDSDDFVITTEAISEKKVD